MRPQLPLRINSLILPEESPKYEDLVARRRLGRTKLSVKPGQIGKSNATLPENLGLFEYAHLRAPLPKDLAGSEIFVYQPKQQQPPETYFLMRRSKDGYVSATGMFKIAFPWATHAEEVKERKYLKTLPETSEDETAGNLWISPKLALSLADEYGMTTWVRALLDPADIPQNTTQATPDNRPIATPPKFDIPPLKPVTIEPPSLARTRGRRSTSPVKSYAPTPIARRTRRTGGTAKDAKEQKEAAQQQINELEAQAYESVKDQKKEQNGTAAAPTTPATKRRGGRRATAKKEEPEPAAAEPQTDKGKEKAAPKAESDEAEKKVANGDEAAEAKEKEPVKEEEQKPEEKTVKEEVKTFSANKQTPSKKPSAPHDPDELPFSLAEMQIPSQEETTSLIARAKEMVAAAAISLTPTKKEPATGSAEVEGAEETTEAEEQAPAAATISKRKAETLEAEDAAIDKELGDTEGNVPSKGAAERPAKRSRRVDLSAQLKKERVRNRGFIGLATVVGIAAAIPYFF